MNGEAVAAAALALVGVRFRLHGRDPATGLDCIGVAAHALRAAGWIGSVPSGYALRGGDPTLIAGRFDELFERAGGESGGDLLLVAPGAGQLHLMIRTAGGVVHADAALCRVVERPGGVPWPLVGAWRWEDGAVGGEIEWRP